MRHDRSLRLLAASALLFAAGCGAALPPDANGAPAAPDGIRAAQGIVKCPDPNSCTLSNGKGVYYDENGSAGLDDQMHILITHFDNGEKEVTFEGRYFDFDQGTWQDLPTSGIADAASFAGDDWDVLEIHETGSAAAVTLRSRTSGKVVVALHKDLLDLTLRLRIENPMKRGKLAFYLLRFTTADTDGNLSIYMPEWRPDVFGSSWQPYCLDAGNKADSAVFQEGIQVDAVNGMVVSGAAARQSVTFSCRLGAPATCERWGYDSLKYDWHFPACIHMKRASYCGDAYGFTYSGTKILAADSAGVMSDKIDDTVIEAKWSPKGAMCVTNPRHPQLGFTFMCNGSPMPKCPTPLLNGDPEYLLSGNP